MRLIAVLCVLILHPFLMTAEPSSEKLTDLRALQWTNRVLLVFAENGSNGEELFEELEARQSEIDERDLLWFVLSDNGVKTNYPQALSETFADSVRKRHASGTGKLEVVLIGKDGGVKGRYDRVDLPMVFARIDSMPMRQAEMRQD